MRRQSGITLLELIIAMAIMGAVIFSVPALGLWMRQQGAGLAADQIRADIQLARLMAIRHKSQCAVVLHTPDRGQWRNSISGQWGSLKQYKGGVCFLNQGPDGRPAASEIVFNRRGMSTSVVPKNIYLADAELSRIYRIQVRLPGGISVHRWGKNSWH